MTDNREELTDKVETGETLGFGHCKAIVSKVIAKIPCEQTRGQILHHESELRHDPTKLGNFYEIVAAYGSELNMPSAGSKLELVNYCRSFADPDYSFIG